MEGGDQAGRQEGERRKLEFRPVVRRVLDGYRHDWKLLLGAGLLVFVPIGLIGAVQPLGGWEIDDWDGGLAAVLILLLITQATLSLLGAVFYSGVVAAGEEERRSGARHGLGHVARNLPYRALILADLALIVVIAFGLVLFIVPGFIFLVWFALIAPVIEMEHRGARDAFRRSRAMVRQHTWRVAAVVIPLWFVQAALEAVGDEIGHELLGETFIGNWVGITAANLLAAPLYALTVLALYFEILERENPAVRGPVDQPQS